MSADKISFGLLSAVILSLPLCITVHLAFRWFGARTWTSERQKRFRKSLILTLLIFGAPYTLGNVIDAATHESGTYWGVALVSIYLGYPMILVVSAAIAYGLSFTVKKEENQK